MTTPSPLFNAPFEMLWGSDYDLGVFHLLKQGELTAECGYHAGHLLPITAIQAGGYSRPACLLCVAAYWNEVLRLGK